VVWVSEAYGIDAVSRLAYLAALTDKLRIGSGILPIYTRTPALLAQTAAGLDYVSNGRFILGLGASGPQVIEGWHGLRYDRPLQRTREIVDVALAEGGVGLVRRLLVGVRHLVAVGLQRVDGPVPDVHQVVTGAIEAGEDDRGLALGLHP